jgi:Tfp pilus assembly protein FimT
VEFLIVLGILALLQVLVAAAAADTRDGNDWANHRRI